MSKQEFLRKLEGELSLPQGTLKENETLAGIDGWDSMAAVQFIAIADEKLGVAVSGAQIASAATVNDLLSLLGDRLTA